MCCQIHPNSHPIQYLIPIFGWVRCLPVVTYIAHVPSYPQNTTLAWLEIYASKQIIHLFRCWIHRFVSFEVWHFVASIPHILCVLLYIYIIHIITCDHIMIYHDNPHVLLYFWVESQRYPNNEVAITAHSTPSETLTPHEPSDLPEGIVRMKGGSQRAIRVCVKIVYP